jgi:S-DNA-T family DNA segregation ATPase FtsK/SpoIIIE
MPQRSGARARPQPKKKAPWPLRAIRGIGMGTAHAVGGGVRSIGHGARDVSPEVRRDGLAILLVIIAVLIAAREWWGLSSQAGTAIHWVVAGTFGVIAVSLPVVLVAMAVRLMRAPQEGHTNYRITVGGLGLAMTIGGLIHIAENRPNPADGLEPLQGAGGILGFLVGSPLSAILTVPLAIIVLTLLTLLGILVVIGMPLREAIVRLRDLVARVMHRDGYDDDPLDLPEHRTLEPSGTSKQGKPTLARAVSKVTRPTRPSLRRRRWNARPSTTSSTPPVRATPTRAMQQPQSMARPATALPRWGRRAHPIARCHRTTPSARTATP